MTWWKGEFVSGMTPQRAREARKEVVEWANNYEKTTRSMGSNNSVQLGHEAKAFIKTFDEARKGVHP